MRKHQQRDGLSEEWLTPHPRGEASQLEPMKSQKMEGLHPSLPLTHTHTHTHMHTEREREKEKMKNVLSSLQAFRAVMTITTSA